MALVYWCARCGSNPAPPLSFKTWPYRTDITGTASAPTPAGSMIYVNARGRSLWQAATMESPDPSYLRDRAARFRDLASRVDKPEHECYLLWLAAIDEHAADTAGDADAC